MAAPARKPAPAAAPSAKKPPPGKGKAAPADSGDDKTPPVAAPPKIARLRIVLFGVLGGLILATLGVGTWFAFFRAPEIVQAYPPPPALKPIPPTVVREGDLGDELWRRLGVRPEQD